LALAHHLVLQSSPENGGDSKVITEAEQRSLAQAISRESKVLTFSAKASTTEYVVIDIFFSDADSETPDYSVTIMLRFGFLSNKDKQTALRPKVMLHTRNS
jgi:hypothetical protein